MKWLTLTQAGEIPDQWDKVAGKNIFLKKDFLRHLEKVNPCRQTYNLLIESNQLKAIYVDYYLKLDIFTHSLFTLKAPIRILGIPCSVSKQGFSVVTGYERELMGHFKEKKGAKLVLNSVVDLQNIKGNTLPTCKMKVCWTSFRDYLQSLRSPYRYRIKKAQEKWKEVKIEFLKPRNFERECYRLYEDVFKNSQAKLEKLNFGFFQQLPLPSVIIKASLKEHTLGFVQLVENGSELIFLFIGFDYKTNKSFDTYYNLLLEIISFAIENGFTTIDFGQTAEETKLKLGSKLIPKNMYISHSNGLLDKWVNRYISFFSYNIPEYNFHVFKDGRE